MKSQVDADEQPPRIHPKQGMVHVGEIGVGPEGRDRGHFGLDPHERLHVDSGEQHPGDHRHVRADPRHEAPPHLGQRVKDTLAAQADQLPRYHQEAAEQRQPDPAEERRDIGRHARKTRRRHQRDRRRQQSAGHDQRGDQPVALAGRTGGHAAASWGCGWIAFTGRPRGAIARQQAQAMSEPRIPSSA